MSSSRESSDDVKIRACQTAWRSLAQDDPQSAAEALRPFAEQTTEDESLATVWCAMMGWVDDLDHLEREIRRLARVWAATSQVVTEMARAILRAWNRRRGPSPFAERESVIGLGVDLIDLCLNESPPSKPDQRATLYLLRAALLAWAGPLGDERALEDIEIALTLTPEDGAGWFQLARLHLIRGRWDKAALATERALFYQFDDLRSGWNLAVALTAHAPHTLNEARSLKEAWALAGHDEFAESSVIDNQGRAVALGLPHQLVAVHTQMNSLGGWELDRPWASEVVWVQPLSPCHGRLLHPTAGQFPADFDDLILWDPQPARFERVEGEERPVMSALALLERGGAVVRPLPRPRLTQSQLRHLDDLLPKGVFFHQAQDGSEITGKLCWPRGMVASEVSTHFQDAWTRLDLDTH